MWSRESVARWCRCVCKSGTCARRTRGCAVSCAKRYGDRGAPRARPRRCPGPTRGCARRCGYRRSTRRRWRRRWPRLARVGRSVEVAVLPGQAAFAAPPRPAARGARPWAQAAAGVGGTARSAPYQPRRACVISASRMWLMASVPPRSSRSMYKPTSGGSCVRAGVGRATALTRPGKSSRPHRTGCSPIRPTAPLCGRACYSNACLPRPLNRVRHGQQGLPWPPVLNSGRGLPLFESLGQAILDHQHQAASATRPAGEPLKQVDRSARAWLWTSVTVDAAYFHIDPSRSAAAAAKLFGDRSIPFWSATAIAPTRSWPASSRAGSCWRGVGVTKGAILSTAPPGRCHWRSGARHGSVTSPGYWLNKKRLAHYKPGLEQQDEAFEAAQRALETEIWERLFATATQQLRGAAQDGT